MKETRFRRAADFLPSMLFSFIFISNGVCQSFFTDITKESGIDFKYTFGDNTYENILESSGSGISILDYNNDGWMDIYMLNGTYLEGISDPEGAIFSNTPNRLFKNNGDGTFAEVAAMAGVDDRHWSMAAGVFDYDGDGDTDIFLLNYGPNVFYRNNGDGTFSDMTDLLGLRGPDNLNNFVKWSVGVVFWDYNEDGRGDLMVGNFLAFDPAYVSPSTPEMMPHPSEYKGQVSILYEQQSDGTFKDVTEKAGFYYPESKCMGLTVFDYDHDGDLDLFQGNDHQLNFLFRNNGQHQFEEVGIAAGIAANDQGLPTGSMHGSVGDIDGDGFMDLLVTDLKYGALYRNLGDGTFEDITSSSNVARDFNGKGQWGANLFDYDNDGDLDIFTANGTAEELILQYPLLLENNGLGIFKNVGTEKNTYFETRRSGRASATFDFDNDGDLDLLVSHIDLLRDPVFLRNDSGNKSHWLGISLLGGHGPASSLGAQIEVYYDEERHIFINQPANTYLTYNDPRVHVGLGKSQKVDKIKLIWPDGTHEVIMDIPIDQYITIKEGEGIL